MANTHHAETTNQKINYSPSVPQEQFIVPLLRNEIENVVHSYLRSHRDGGLKLKVLDVGCGGQPFRALIESLDCAYSGFDIAQNKSGTNTYLGRIDKPLPETLSACAPFDFLLCTEVLEHVADWRSAFFNLNKLLRIDGKALITCPHFYQLHEEPHDYWRPTTYALRHYGDMAGLRVVYEKRAGDAWDVMGTLLANCDFYPRAANLRDRLINKVVNIAKRRLTGLLISRSLQTFVGDQGPLYLSNVMLFEKHEDID